MKKVLCIVLAALLATTAGAFAEGATPLTAEMDARLHAELQARIDEILATQTQIVKSDEWIPGQTYTGTAYYVSPNGNDEWDGLTPETPKQSLRWVMEVSRGKFEQILEPGDAVFFERGGVYRYDLKEDIFDLAVPRVTYSAYGEGPKPILTLSIESGVGADKWQLAYEDAAGVKIWQYYRDMADTGGIILNDGEVYATRVYEWWNGVSYESCAPVTLQGESGKGVVLKGELLPLQDSLTEDLTIISRPDLTGMPDGEFIYNHYQGPLYLRCDAGNPGELYDSVEFITQSMTGLFQLVASDLVFDNLSIRHTGRAIFTNGQEFEPEERSGSALHNTLIQNCEVCFHGTSVTNYVTLGSENRHISTNGDGFYNVCNDLTLRNNYLHDMYCVCMGFEADESFYDPFLGSLQILDNVMVDTGGLRFDSNAETMRHFEAVVVRGNQIWSTRDMDMGYYGYREGTFFYLPWHYGDYIFEDNVLYGTFGKCYSNALYDTARPDHEAYPPVRFSGNTYVQYAGGNFAYIWDIGSLPIDDPNLVEHAREWMDEDSGTFYVIGAEETAASGGDAPESAPEAVEIADSWDEILAAIDDGTARERYPVGATKELDLGDFGTIRMQLAGFDLDDRADGSGKAATTWIALDLLDARIMNQALAGYRRLAGYGPAGGAAGRRDRGDSRKRPRAAGNRQEEAAALRRVAGDRRRGLDPGRPRAVRSGFPLLRPVQG